MTSARNIEYYSNGRLISRQTLLSDAQKVGFSVSATAPTATTIRDGFTYGKDYVPASAGECVVSVIGDSISYGAWSAATWPELLPIALSGLPGGGEVKVRQNLAVSSTKAQNWATPGDPVDIKQYSFAGDTYVLVLLGTNDGAARPVANFTADLSTIAAKIVADGALPVFGMFPLWTNAGLSGVVGVTPASPSQVQRLRHAILKFCVTNGYPVALVESAFGDSNRWLGDNIHPVEEGMAPIARAFAQAIARHRAPAAPQ
ncbi:SGNH/GDSL hydrolase family protein [Mycetocola zhadangensis]|uniref:SGNH/GDSL hydrolase family protein n=1 Tax=Mycetocola zhadangensis TaxID=1164595 RepID=UPI003A4D70C8